MREQYDTLVAAAYALYQKDSYAEAASQAAKATKLDAKRWEGFWIGGLSLYRLDRAGEAVPALKSALAGAPEDQKPTIEELLKMCGNKIAFDAHVAAAEKAAEEGLLAKAAREYTAAWDLFQNRDDIGLKAAKLWSDRLNAPAEAWRIITYIAAHSGDAPTVESAREFLRNLEPVLKKQYEEKLAAGKAALQDGKPDDALTLLEQAVLLRPERQEAALLVARIYAGRKDIPNTTKALGIALKAGPIAYDTLFLTVEFGGILKDKDFLAWINDAMGPEAAAKARLITPDMIQKASTANSIDETTKNSSVTVRGETDLGPIRSISHNANRALQAGDVLTVEIVADEGGRATFDLVDENNRTVVQGVGMTEISRGKYRGTYTLINRDIGVLKVVGRFRDAANKTTTRETTTTVKAIGSTN